MHPVTYPVYKPLACSPTTGVCSDRFGVSAISEDRHAGHNWVLPDLVGQIYGAHKFSRLRRQAEATRDTFVSHMMEGLLISQPKAFDTLESNNRLNKGEAGHLFRQAALMVDYDDKLLAMPHHAPQLTQTLQQHGDPFKQAFDVVNARKNSLFNYAFMKFLHTKSLEPASELEFGHFSAVDTGRVLANPNVGLVSPTKLLNENAEEVFSLHDVGHVLATDAMPDVYNARFLAPVAQKHQVLGKAFVTTHPQSSDFMVYQVSRHLFDSRLEALQSGKTSPLAVAQEISRPLADYMNGREVVIQGKRHKLSGQLPLSVAVVMAEARINEAMVTLATDPLVASHLPHPEAKKWSLEQRVKFLQTPATWMLKPLRNGCCSMAELLALKSYLRERLKEDPLPAAERQAAMVALNRLDFQMFRAPAPATTLLATTDHAETTVPHQG